MVGTNVGVLTDDAGRYVLTSLTAGNVPVQVRLLGHIAGQEVVTVRSGESVVADFALDEEALALDEVVVTGTPGQARRREVGNSIAQLDVGAFDEPAGNVDQLLQSRSPSVTVTRGGSSFGAGAAIRLRGNVSVTLSNQPLIFVDGVRQTAEAYPLNASAANFANYGPSAVQSPLNDINPADIERIEIVKGPAAATLYGSEASAGVIQIFTRKGAQGRASWTFHTDHSLDWVQPFGSKQRPYIGLDPWLKTAYANRTGLSVSGGLTELRYFVSGGYDRGEGVLPNDEEQRVALRINLDLQARPDLNFQFSSAFTSHHLGITHTGNSSMAIPFNAYRAPNNALGSADFDVLNQLVQAEIEQDNQRVTVGLTARWNPFVRLTQNFTVGLDRVASRGTQFRPLGFVLEPKGAVSDIRWESETLTADYTGSYAWLSGSGLSSSVSWGGQSISTSDSKLDSYGTGFPGPGRQTLSSVAERQVYGSEFRIVSAGFFLQNTMGLRDRIFLTAGARVDGTSTFGANLGLQIYPKASISWVASDESFWPESLGSLKLRAAFGQAGRAPDAFAAVRTWTPGSFGGESAFVPGNVGNPDLGPEKTREVEFGFDGAWWGDRLTGEVTYYRQNTRDALFNVTQIPTLGFTGNRQENIGELTNEGLEVSLNGAVFSTEVVSWSVGTSLSLTRSEVLDVGTSTTSTIQVGHPVPVVRGTKVANANEYAPPVIERDAFFGPSVPTHVVGLSSTFDLPRGLSLSARGEYQGGHFISDGASANMIDRGNGAPFCDDAYEHVPFRNWPNGNLERVTALERLRCYRANTVSGSWVYPADFFKLRDVTLVAPLGGWVPGVRSALLTLSLQNAFRWTNKDFGAFDPEMISSRANTSALIPGITEAAPAPARFVTSIRISF